jgi:farnesyl-diphosphate farnesyltransferase
MNNNLLLADKIVDPGAYCDFILPHVSRSFALGINTLKGQLRKNILIGYLLCRIADTIEDDVNLSSEKKCVYLEEFLNCFLDQKKWSFISEIASELNGDPFHINLVKNAHFIFATFETLSSNSKFILMNWVKEMSTGMIKFIKKYPLGIRISSLSEYKEYCYYVAGTVGFMLTDLWHEYGFCISNGRYNLLKKSAGIFGEALQTINILKDISWDIQNENAIFIPLENLSESKVVDIVNLAEKDLNISIEYIKSIPRINFRIRFFCIFPLLLAFATLREIRKSKSILNPNEKIKVTRAEVKKIYKHSFIASISNYWLTNTAKKLFK